ncbi:SDR family NAD(P)-dependent oxidoreductase [Chelativorans sp. Marseille-P2723]|uniref:SDR family NAD(P)-dependent oxidoreductase n=1 Tax=Chelativorans sp. Marseille-P2723 TaxID=2709133 RepID=UPI00157036E1|nr:SDR family NAD(P)-dependent oxidoreductase [Chelativorans sp. Marseille-P2723]
MNAEFQGQNGVITGAARGLGRTVARMFAEGGGVAVMVDIDREGVESAAAELRGRGLAAHAVAADLAQEEELAVLRGHLKEVCNDRLDLLVNNAGGWRHGRAAEISMSDWEWTFRINVTAAFLTTRALMDLMIARGDGRIVNVASTDAHRAKPTLPHYAAAKAALVSLTKSLAEELAPHQVLVNAVSPGAIATEAARQQQWFAERIKSIPLGRAAEPEDIAEVILFLGSRRNRFVVGQTLMVNGGMLMA